MAKFTNYIEKKLITKDPFDDQKKLLSGETVKCIFDVGGNKGQSAKKYFDLYPDATTYSFEPYLPVYKKLKEEFKNNMFIKTFNIAISSKKEKRCLNVNKKKTLNSLKPSNEDSKYWTSKPHFIDIEDKIKVQSTTIDIFSKENNIDRIDILKLDIQGAELDALIGAEKLLENQSILLIYTEINFVPLYKDIPLFHDLASFLYSHNYFLFDLYDLVCTVNGQIKKGDAIFINKKLQSKKLDELKGIINKNFNK